MVRRTMYDTLVEGSQILTIPSVLAAAKYRLSGEKQSPVNVFSAFSWSWKMRLHGFPVAGSQRPMNELELAAINWPLGEKAMFSN